MKYIAIVLTCMSLALVSFTTSTPSAAAQVKKKGPAVKDFRKGIKTHQDWIKRFKETYDPRILKILRSRAGVMTPGISMRRGNEVVKIEGDDKISEVLKNFPDDVDRLLEAWGILVDHVAFEKKEEEAWRKRFGKNAVVLRSDHYLVLGTKQDAKYTKLLHYYMEKAFDLYAKKFATDESIEGRFVVQLYPDRQSFMATGAPSFAAAYFNASGRSLVGFVPLDSARGKESVAKDMLVRTFFHEGFHQYLHYYVPDPPIWLDEGFAEMFSAVHINKTKLAQGKLINNTDLKVLRSAIKDGKTPYLKTFMYMDRRTYYANPQLHYPQGWGVTHFLAFGSPTYQKYFKNILTHLKNGMSRQEAMDETFKSVNWSKMESLWRTYITKKVKPTKTISNYIY